MFSGFGFVGSRHNDGGGLDSSSDSQVPTHGATSVPSVSGISGNPFFSVVIRCGFTDHFKEVLV